MDENKIDTGTLRLVHMYSKPQLALKWFRYILLASNGRGHGVHSPFVYELIREVFDDNRNYDAYGKIESLRKNLLRDERIAAVEETHGGSQARISLEKKLSQIAARSLSTRKFGRLLFRLAKHYQAGRILELGTSLGISASYLASANASSHVITLEGLPAVASIAAETFQQLNLENIVLVTGRFEETLENVLRENPPVDLVFLDGHHQKKPVLEYFEQFLEKLAPASLIIIHDIHWSHEMEEAWAIIREHPKVKMTVDIFSAGLVFFREEFQVKQHFMIRF
jgi:predicted O-methyltransferase YrrM